MPGSLLNLDRKISRHDSTRSDISTYSNDSKKKVSFNKAVRVKKYTRSEDGDKHTDKKNFWFKVYKDIDPDVWEEYSGDDDKYHSDDKLKTIDESSAMNHVTDESKKKNNIQHIIDKFNEQSLNRDEEGSSSNDTLTKYKRNNILNGMKAFFNSSSLKSKKKNGSVKERNLENLFRNESYDNLLANDSNQRNDLKINKISEEWVPEKYEGNLRKIKEHDFDRKFNSAVDIKKWESGDQLIFDTWQYDKNVDKTDKGELTKTVEERDQIWQNVTRTITYAESSPKIIKKVKENNKKSNERISDCKKKDNHLLTNMNRKDRAVQCNNMPITISEPLIKNSDKYKVIRSKNGIVSAYSNAPLLDKDKPKVNRTRNSLNNLCRTNVCTRDHNQNSNRNIEKKLKIESNVARKFKQDKMVKDSSRDSSPCYRSDASDYRRGLSTLRNSRRGNKNRSKPKETAPSINNIKITVNGEDIENQSLRGEFVPFNNRQRARNLNTSPLRSGSDTESTHEHKTVFLYIPGISHQQRPADNDEESGVTVMRSSSIKGKRPAKYHYYGNRSKPKDFDYINEL